MAYMGGEATWTDPETGKLRYWDFDTKTWEWVPETGPQTLIGPTPTPTPTGSTFDTLFARIRAATSADEALKVWQAAASEYNAGRMTWEQFEQIQTIYNEITGQAVARPTDGGGLVAKPQLISDTNIPTRPTWPTGEFEAAFPQAAWGRAYGLPAYGMNPFQEWLSSQAAPAYASWLGGQLVPGTLPSEFAPLGGVGGGTALGALRAMRGLGEPEQELWQTEIAGEGGTAALSNLLRAALGTGGRGYATPIANIMARRIPALQRGWQQQTQAGITGPTFLDYLMQKYGL